MRTPLIAGNWKLNKTIDEAVSFVHQLKPLIQDASGVEVLVCPVFTALGATKAAVEGSAIQVGAQDMFWKDKGAYTGEVSAPLLRDAGCTHVIIGHSERRGRFGVPEPELAGDAGRVFGDTDAAVNKKLHAAIQHGLVPIVCVGETLDERKAGDTDEVVQAQICTALEGIGDTAAGLVFAYEPVWAIGTGETCEAEEADRVCGVVRAAVGELFGSRAAESVRVQYGGSVKPDNAADLLSRPHIDGALVGGASLQAESFASIVRAARW
ncbi:MAG: triose-phosphate isomerase [Armatimonadota bacterium]|nr:triose-phosphate isomerase [Armatimonadota bacterium]